MQSKKPIIWMGSSRSDLIAMPEGVRKDFGGALHGAQEGRQLEQAKPLKGKSKGATQLSEDHDGDTYRAVFTVELEGAIYVLHCFQKKSKSGISTPRTDIDLIERRLKDARALHAQRNGKKS
ncbi:addiction module toxin RelE [Sphingopyxis sp. Root214]|uniref:type II toxin-antitoxin system RelE/ParE family toxin n=1 Tax=unclassified Sphingopyxis TaxID=2614943 RepID=UPI0006F46B55|nr:MULTISPECIES: type II toxin-antitoxin system RelE/ParE family toxin [unclassified Sphingopyxis]KQZ76561.1 addiction module toxin RelE [Sphingopyxis sp. Root154]KRC09552.1 addiction module toxin RelE [Sphingopyxis sp. Root214]